MDILAGKECSAAGDGEQNMEDITEFPPAPVLQWAEKEVLMTQISCRPHNILLIAKK